MFENQAENSTKHFTEQQEDTQALKSFPEILNDSLIGSSQEELSEKSGVSSMQISRLKAGKHTPSIKTLVKIAPYTGYSLEELLAASSYTGVVPTTEKTYIDLTGRRCNLKAIAEEMYKTDAELFFKTYEFYKHYSSHNSEFIKIILDELNMENKILQSKKAATSDEKDFCKIFSHLKSLLLILGQKLKMSVC